MTFSVTGQRRFRSASVRSLSIPPTSSPFFSVSYSGDKFVFLSRKIDAVSGCQSDKSGIVKANGLADAAKRISERGGEIGWAQSYERRMRIFNLEVVLAALIALAVLIVWLFMAWEAFQKSMPFSHVLSRPLASSALITFSIVLRASSRPDKAG
jgi:hypothetical protein